MRINPNSPMIVWRLTDGKPGHESQTAGLVKFLQKRLNCKVIVISEMIRDYVLRNYHTDPQRLVLNYRGIDPSQYNPTYAPTQQWQDRWFQQCLQPYSEKHNPL